MNPYGLVISFASLLGLLLTKSRAKIYNLKPEVVENLFLVLVPLSVIGGRAYHVIDKWSYYYSHPAEIFYIWQGGLGIFGALIGGFLGVWIYSSLTRTSPVRLLDCLAPSIALAQSLGRFGNYFNQEGYGPPTNLPWRVFISPEHRLKGLENFNFFHPTFFYESLLCFLLFLTLLKLTSKTKPTPGSLFGIYLLGYGLIRFFTEGFRIDTASIQSFKVAHIFALLFIIWGILILNRFKKTKF